MFPNLKQTLHFLSQTLPSSDRQVVLQPLIEYVHSRVKQGAAVRLNFICTHNSRRSHLSQIWAQTMAFHFGIKEVFCYSGGTETTAMFPKVAETLSKQGFAVWKLSQEQNPVYAVKFAENDPAIICFSKKFDDVFNPSADFAAIMTCSSADQGCPLVAGATQRIAVLYEDPKVYDGTDQMDQKYAERSLQIATEMYYVFSQIRHGVQ